MKRKPKGEEDLVVTSQKEVSPTVTTRANTRRTTISALNKETEEIPETQSTVSAKGIKRRRLKKNGGGC